MKKKFIALTLVLFALIVFGVYLVSGIGEKTGFSEEQSKNIAREFVQNSPTYRFDRYNLTYKETLYPEIAEHPNLYVFVFEFTSKHGGFGDRTGKTVTEVITPHEAHIYVEDGEVIRAVLDQKWDMIKQSIIK